MDKKHFTIGVLSLSAVVLLAANLIQPRLAEAAFVVKDNDYTAVTGRTNKGGEALYILDNRTGAVVVVAFDVGRRSVQTIAGPKPLMDAFAGGGGAGGGVNPGGGRPPRR